MYTDIGAQERRPIAFLFTSFYHSVRSVDLIVHFLLCFTTTLRDGLFSKKKEEQNTNQVPMLAVEKDSDSHRVLPVIGNRRCCKFLVQMPLNIFHSVHMKRSYYLSRISSFIIWILIKKYCELIVEQHWIITGRREYILLSFFFHKVMEKIERKDDCLRQLRSLTKAGQGN